MEFFFAIFFLLFYYIRPQDWMPGLAGANLIKPIVGLWLLSLILARSRSSPLPGFLRTPHDWVIVLYLGYIVFFAEGSLFAVLPMLAFYCLTLQSVNSWERVSKYLRFWNGALLAVATIAILSTVGFDVTGAQDNFFTQQGRLAINTWLHNNPNALAHSVVVVIPLSFVLYFWKGSLTGRFFVFPLFAAIAFYCAWLTQSKGAYLVGGATITLALIVGRPRWVQILAISVAVVSGISALSFLPRMADMNNLRADEGVQGRLLAWEMARTAERNHPTGIGWKQFIAEFEWQEGNTVEWVKKATHSSYVQIGADLGRYGLFLYLAGIWCALHTLLVLRTNDHLQERCRRALMILLLANVMSGWMINRQYHTEYFLLIAAAAAMHRLGKAADLRNLAVSETSSEDEAGEAAESGGGISQIRNRIREEHIKPAFIPESKQAQPLRYKPLWNRFGILDMTCCLGLTWLTLWAWDYLLSNI